MKQTIKVQALTDWKDVPLRKYLELMSDIEAYKDDQEAVDALMLHHLCGIPYDEIQNVSTESYKILKSKKINYVQILEADNKKTRAFWKKAGFVRKRLGAPVGGGLSDV